MLNANLTDWIEDPLLCKGLAKDAAVVVRPPKRRRSPSTREAFAAFRQRVHEAGGLVLVRHERNALIGPAAVTAPLPPGARDAIRRAPLVEPVAYKVRCYRPDDLALSVICPRAGYLLVTERWTRSWEASVNGHEVSVEGGDFLFRLVPVKAGEKPRRDAAEPRLALPACCPELEHDARGPGGQPLAAPKVMAPLTRRRHTSSFSGEHRNDERPRLIRLRESSGRQSFQPAQTQAPLDLRQPARRAVAHGVPRWL